MTRFHEFIITLFAMLTSSFLAGFINGALSQIFAGIAVILFFIIMSIIYEELSDIRIHTVIKEKEKRHDNKSV